MFVMDLWRGGKKKALLCHKEARFASWGALLRFDEEEQDISPELGGGVVQGGVCIVREGGERGLDAALGETSTQQLMHPLHAPERERDSAERIGHRKGEMPGSA